MTNRSTYLRYALLIPAILGLCLYSLLFIYSTGYIGDEYPVRLNWQRQAIFLTAGFAVVMPISFILCRSWLRKWFIYGGYGASLIALLLVLLFGQKTGGATRWFSVGPFLFQPAEYAKAFTVLAMAEYLPSLNGKPLKSILSAAALLFPPFILILVEPSYGSAATMIPAAFVVIMLHLPGKRLFQASILAAMTAIILGTAALLWMRTEHGGRTADGILTYLTENSGFLKNYHVKRIKGYLDEKGDWNERQSVLTISSGGVSGKGYLQGTMKGLGFLPRTVAPTDFIFPVICEELGFLYGAVPIMILYTLLLAILLYSGYSACTMETVLVCTGIAALLFAHIAVNIAMTMRLLPVIGLPLPLLSYGGSYAIAVFICLGAAMAGDDTENIKHENPSFTIRIGRFLKLSLNE